MAFFQLFIKSERHLNDESLAFYDGKWVVGVDFWHYLRAQIW
jgi:hypothetical protein